MDEVPSCRHRHPPGDGVLVNAGEPVWRYLESLRGLSDGERRLLGELAKAVDEPLLHQQVATAAVTVECRCGCSSVRLHSDEPPIPEARIVQLSRHDRPDYFSVEAVGHTADLADVQFVLHVVGGRVHELEVNAGEGVAGPLAALINPTAISVA
jgi:hypothetical protein